MPGEKMSKEKLYGVVRSRANVDFEDALEFVVPSRDLFGGTVAGLIMETLQKSICLFLVAGGRRRLETGDSIFVNVSNNKPATVASLWVVLLKGFGKFNIYLILVSGLCLLGCNSEGYGISYVLTAAECDLNLDTFTKGLMTSANSIGIMGSCCFWGYISDTKGRRRILMISLYLTFICSFIAALTPSFWGFTTLRFLAGVFISGPCGIIFAYFGEFHGRNHRSRAMACISLFVGLALVALPAAAWLLLPLNVNWHFIGIHINPWRLFMLLISFPNAIVALTLIRFPESPKYLYHTGRPQQALQVMRRVYAINTGNPEDTFPVSSLQEKVFEADYKSAKAKSFIKTFADQIVPLFKLPHLKYTLAASFMQAGVFAVSSGWLLWYPDIINQLSLSKDKQSMTTCEALSSSTQMKNETSAVNCTEAVIDDDVFIQNIITGTCYIVGYISWSFLVGFLGHRNFYMICMTISSVALVLLIFIGQKIVIDALFVTFLVLSGICVAIISSILVDIIPTNLCAMAICLTMTAGRLGSVVSSTIIGILLEWNCTATFGFYVINGLGCILLALIFPKKSIRSS